MFRTGEEGFVDSQAAAPRCAGSFARSGGGAAAGARGAEALARKRAAGAHLRRDFLDAGEWDRLAHRYGVRLPQRHLAPKPGKMGVWLRRLGVSLSAYREWTADRTLADFGRLNPSWGLRPWVGMLLEAVDAGLVSSPRRLEPEPEGEAPEEPEVPGSVVEGRRRGRAD